MDIFAPDYLVLAAVLIYFAYKVLRADAPENGDKAGHAESSPVGQCKAAHRSLFRNFRQ